eukprot:scaffold70830_cov60-Phaeocystis_antarctica.AAC.2
MAEAHAPAQAGMIHEVAEDATRPPLDAVKSVRSDPPRQQPAGDFGKKSGTILGPARTIHVPFHFSQTPLCDSEALLSLKVPLRGLHVVSRDDEH